MAMPPAAPSVAIAIVLSLTLHVAGVAVLATWRAEPVRAGPASIGAQLQGGAWAQPVSPPVLLASVSGVGAPDVAPEAPESVATTATSGRDRRIDTAPFAPVPPGLPVAPAATAQAPEAVASASGAFTAPRPAAAPARDADLVPGTPAGYDVPPIPKDAWRIQLPDPVFAAPRAPAAATIELEVDETGAIRRWSLLAVDGVDAATMQAWLHGLDSTPMLPAVRRGVAVASTLVVEIVLGGD